MASHGTKIVFPNMVQLVVFALETLLSCNNDTHTGEETFGESLLQGAYEASIKTRKDFEQLEVENPVKAWLFKQSNRWIGRRDQSSKWRCWLQEKDWEEAMKSGL